MPEPPVSFGNTYKFFSFLQNTSVSMLVTDHTFEIRNNANTENNVVNTIILHTIWNTGPSNDSTPIRNPLCAAADKFDDSPLNAWVCSKSANTDHVDDTNASIVTHKHMIANLGTLSLLDISSSLFIVHVVVVVVLIHSEDDVRIWLSDCHCRWLTYWIVWRCRNILCCCMIRSIDVCWLFQSWNVVPLKDVRVYVTLRIGVTNIGMKQMVGVDRDVSMVWINWNVMIKLTSVPTSFSLWGQKRINILALYICPYDREIKKSDTQEVISILSSLHHSQTNKNQSLSKQWGLS